MLEINSDIFIITSFRKRAEHATLEATIKPDHSSGFDLNWSGITRWSRRTELSCAGEVCMYRGEQRRVFTSKQTKALALIIFRVITQQTHTRMQKYVSESGGVWISVLHSVYIEWQCEMSDGQRYTKAVNLQRFTISVMSGTWKRRRAAFSDLSLSLNTIIARPGKTKRQAPTNTELLLGGPNTKPLKYSHHIVLYLTRVCIVEFLHQTY